MALLYTKCYYATKCILNKNKSQYKRLSIKASIAAKTSAFVVNGNVLEASLTNCVYVDQNIPDEGVIWVYTICLYVYISQ